MDPCDKEERRQLLSSLTAVVDGGVKSIGESEVSQLLWELIVELDAAGYRHRCHFDPDGDGPLLTLEYPTAISLERDIPTLTEVCGLMIEVDPAPPLMQEIDVVISAKGLHDTVQMRGRAVHQSPDGAAIELFPTGAKTKASLHELAENLRASAGSSTSSSRPASPTISQPAPKAADDQAKKPAEVDKNRVPLVDQLIDHPENVEKTWIPRRDSVDKMLLELATVEGYGFLEFSAPRVTRQYVIHYGKLIDVRSDPVDDSEELLIQKLLSTGQIQSEDLERARVLAAIHNITRQDALVDMGCITLEQLLDAIRGRLADELEQIWETDAAEARLYLLAHRPPLRLRRSSIGFTRVVAERIRSRIQNLSRDEIHDLEEQFVGFGLQYRSSAPVEVEQLNLNEKEQRFIEVVLDKPRSISDLRRMSNLRFDRTMQMLLFLDEIGLLERTKLQTQLPEHSDIRGLYQRIAENDHFALLGIHWSAYDQEVERAYAKFNDQLDVPESVAAQMGDKIKRLRQQAETAYAVLSDRKKRREYRNERVDDFTLKSALQVYEKKIDTLRMRKDLVKLLDCLRRVVELNPLDKTARRQVKALEQAVESQ